MDVLRKPNKSSCFCCSLEILSLYIAVLGLIASLGGINAGALIISDINNNGFFAGFDRREFGMEFIYLNANYLGSSIIHLICSILLIIAVVLRSSKLVIPWLVETVIAQGFVIILIMYWFAIGLFLMVFILLFASGFNFLFVWIVFTFRHELKSEEEAILALNNEKGVESVNVNNVMKT